MVGPGQPVFDSMKQAQPVERISAEARGRPLPVPGQIGELDAVVGEHGVDAIRNGFNERFEQGGSSPQSAFPTNSTKANFEVRSIATNR